ncbi:unnamed protein product [Onchocerca flexuosa]|uniref:Ovule protein n=1 Tax=Onchocerca flexuosa TaxID=387005 RepID=A0A183I224_9BILA|nr:unnamed protein product [Onchocerca flexuosa]
MPADSFPVLTSVTRPLHDPDQPNKKPATPTSSIAKSFLTFSTFLGPSTIIFRVVVVVTLRKRENLNIFKGF